MGYYVNGTFGKTKSPIKKKQRREQKKRFNVSSTSEKQLKDIKRKDVEGDTNQTTKNMHLSVRDFVHEATCCTAVEKTLQCSNKMLQCSYVLKTPRNCRKTAETVNKLQVNCEKLRQHTINCNAVFGHIAVLKHLQTLTAGPGLSKRSIAKLSGHNAHAKEGGGSRVSSKQRRAKAQLIQTQQESAKQLFCHKCAAFRGFCNTPLRNTPSLAP